MISTQLIGNYKLVLFVDDIGIERNSRNIIDKILKDQNLSYEFFNGDCEILNKTNIVLEPISKQELENSEKDIFTIVQRLKLNENVSQIFAWISSKNVQSKILAPFLEHMSELIVTIKTDRLLSILSKSKSGSVKLKEYQHELASGKTHIREIKAEKVQQKEKEAVNVETIGTFKIGQFTAEELEAKHNLKLPFEKIRQETNNFDKDVLFYSYQLIS
jgi:hypothetical protein